ncbi:MAG TPA: acyltransferase family protein [Candidatus Corynebacterium avicola]|uniref:Acyltransferase family protein n=1 Tax=Candidatus Corynebacterium avicola TaxID=2838527 RepID=A0A9D1RP71_9CORY|nr:acyltransferase family protein [Candidatus Corynebacterium avicola]
MTSPASPTRPPTATARPRLTWIDTVKGLAILLVVLYHAVELAGAKDWAGDQLSMLTDALITVRMPLFFAMSGYFLLRRIDRPWNWWMRNRIGPFLWLFVLWTVVWLLAFEVIPWQRNDGGIADVLLLFVDPSLGPWYIYALAIYFVAVKLMRPLPVWLQFLIGAVVSLPVACGFVHVESWVWESLLTHFIAFQIGALGSQVLARIATNATVPRMLLVGAVWGAATGGLFLVGLGLDNVLRIPVTALGMTMGVLVAAVLDRYASWLRLWWFGRNTLPIYLLHVPVIGLIYSLDLGLPSSPLVAIGVPLLTTVLAVIMSLAIWRALRVIPGVFTAPWTGEGANTRNVPVSAPVAAAAPVTPERPEPTTARHRKARR